MNTANRIRLCMKDLYQQDVMEMIERESRQFQFWSIETPDDPDFQPAYDLLWDAFGDRGEMEREEPIRQFLLDNPFEPVPSGTYIRYFLLVAKDQRGKIVGVRDGSILVNPGYAPDLCATYLAHIFVLPEARGTVMSYWLRVAPIEMAMQYLAELHQRGLITLPAPDQPGRHFGMRMNLTAEMEYFAPEDRLSLQRILFYGRGGFDVIDPKHFPYVQPDYRDPEEIRQTGNNPVPFMVLLRRMGRERQARIPIDEAVATMKLLYDDFAAFCAPEHLANSLDRVMRRLEDRRAAGKTTVDLLPMPTGSKDLGRLRRLWRYPVYRAFYPQNLMAVREYLEDFAAHGFGGTQKWLDEQLADIARTLDTRPHFVYGSRDRAFNWDGSPESPPQEVMESEPTGEFHIPPEVMRLIR